MATESVDPAGMHQLPRETSLQGGRKNTEFWNGKFQNFDVASDVNCNAKGDPWPLMRAAVWRVVAGSDLLLQCEKLERDVDIPDEYVVRTYDSSGNVLNVLGQFRDAPDAMAALPTLMTIAHMLYPNFLLMARDAQHFFTEKA